MSEPDERFSFYILASAPSKVYLSGTLIFTMNFSGRRPYESNYTMVFRSKND